MRQTLVLSSLLILGSLSSSISLAATSIWTPQPSPYASQLNNYQQTRCSQSVPTAYTGHLRIESKYDQSDKTRSTLNDNRSQESARIQAQVQAFHVGLVRFVSSFENARNANQAKEALSCFNLWLETWARAGAIQSRDTTDNGKALRKWSLAAMSSSALKMQNLSGQHYSPSTFQRNWLDRLSNLVMADYQPRLSPAYLGFNNHDYWAALSVALTGMLLNRDNMITWSDQALRRGISQITLSRGRDYGYLPLEAARGSLGADYTHYALVPLVLLAEIAQRNGRPLTAAEREKLEHLATFAARAIIEPRRLPELQGTQTAVESHKMAWLIPFLQNRPNHNWASRLYQTRNGNVDNYSQIGGAIKHFYSRMR